MSRANALATQVPTVHAGDLARCPVLVDERSTSERGLITIAAAFPVLPSGELCRVRFAEPLHEAPLAVILSEQRSGGRSLSAVAGNVTAEGFDVFAEDPPSQGCRYVLAYQVLP